MTLYKCHRKKNLFKLPKGKWGKEFIKELTHIIDLWSDKSNHESIALTALHVFIPLMLQKPSRKSKNRDHVRYLSERFEKWKCGDLAGLLSEGAEIQKRLVSSKFSPETNETFFVRLMLHGKVSAALKWITQSRSNLLSMTEEVT